MFDVDIIVEMVSFVSQKVLQRGFPALAGLVGLVQEKIFHNWVPSKPTSYCFVYG
jgi:hypothetical protein